jgi:hypothetical protein
MRAIKNPKDPEIGAILAEISNIKVWLDDLDGAETAARAAVEIYQSVPPDYPDRVMADTTSRTCFSTAVELKKRRRCSNAC